MSHVIKIRLMPQSVNLTIRSDAELVIKTMERLRLEAQLTREEDRSEMYLAWSDNPGGVVLADCIKRILERDEKGSTTHLERVKAHVGIEGNEAADRLAAQGVEEELCGPPKELLVSTTILEEP